jgi:hypothetical protein
MSTVVRGLGYMGEVGDDPQLSVKRAAIARYWEMRQPEIVGNFDRYAEPLTRVGERTSTLKPKSGVGSKSGRR